MLKRFTVRIDGIDDISVEYHHCGSHQLSLTLGTNFPYDVASALENAAKELRQNFESTNQGDNNVQ